MVLKINHSLLLIANQPGELLIFGTFLACFVLFLFLFFLILASVLPCLLKIGYFEIQSCL